jgi:hypothetical protein
MFTLSSELNNILQALIIVILIGMLFSVWKTSHAYGGIIGSAVRLIGVGITLLSVLVLERMLVNFSVVENTANMRMVQDILTLLSLLFLSWGFKKLASVAKA